MNRAYACGRIAALVLIFSLSSPLSVHASEAHDDHSQTTSHAKKGAIPVEDHDGPKIETKKVTSAPAHGMAPAAADESRKPAQQAAPATTHVAASSGHHDTTGVAPETSLRWLQNGNTRYLKRNYRKDGREAKDRQRLSTGQKPHAIVLSCSDSRVPPEIVFDQALGEIFVIRVAGEALDSSVVASIEYAIEHLGSKLIVVMGHSQCGAVKAAITTKEGDSAGSADLDRLVTDIRPRLRSVLKEEPSKNLEVESAVNADGVARDLVKRSAIIRNKIESGDIKIKTALYRLDTGKVSFY